MPQFVLAEKEQPGVRQAIDNKIRKIVGNWIDILNAVDEVPDIGTIFVPKAQLTLVETSQSHHIDNIRQRVKKFKYGKHSIQTIGISQNSKDPARYYVHLIIDWVSHLGNEVARFQETIQFNHSRQSDQLLIHSIDEHFILPDDGLGGKLKC